MLDGIHVLLARAAWLRITLRHGFAECVRVTPLGNSIHACCEVDLERYNRYKHKGFLSIRWWSLWELVRDLAKNFGTLLENFVQELERRHKATESKIKCKEFCPIMRCERHSN